MNSATEVLIIILSSTLSIFLLVGIVLGIYVIKLTSDIRKLTQSAEKTASTIESAVSGAAKFTTPVFFADMIVKYMNKVKNASKKGDK